MALAEQGYVNRSGNPVQAADLSYFMCKRKLRLHKKHKRKKRVAAPAQQTKRAPDTLDFVAVVANASEIPPDVRFGIIKRLLNS